MRKINLVFAITLMWAALPVRAAVYSVDPAHSSVMFRIHHLLGKVTGRFDKYDGYFDYDAKNLKLFKASATIDASSINTNVEKRDEHLRSADFFDVQKFPTLTFVSKGLTDIKGSKGKLSGDLTMHGVTKPIVLDVEFNGEAKDPWGGTRAAISATSTVKRADWGITWNKVLDAGGVLVGEDVEIILEIEGVKK